MILFPNSNPSPDGDMDHKRDHKQDQINTNIPNPKPFRTLPETPTPTMRTKISTPGSIRLKEVAPEGENDYVVAKRTAKPTPLWTLRSTPVWQ
mmetsp:Transcript_18103/g.28832  ORF Transcript_18103/g.28832 Transcript_18103/m.28832 type:complete len:93 (+) Transcript_18103:197-475(+)